jgi:stress response protein YsnF
VDSPLDTIPEVREEGDTLVIPVVEEVLTIERRLVLKEEIRIQRVRATHLYEESVNVHSQEVTITHEPPVRAEAQELRLMK